MKKYEGYVVLVMVLSFLLIIVFWKSWPANGIFFIIGVLCAARLVYYHRDFLD